MLIWAFQLVEWYIQEGKPGNEFVQLCSCDGNVEIEWKQIKLCGKFSLISLKEMYYCFFGLTAPYLLIADSVQSPIVSFTQYCLLASYNLLKERRSVKQVWDKRWNMYPPFLARWKKLLNWSVLSPLCALCKPLNCMSNLVFRCQYLLVLINCSSVQKGEW